MPRSAAPQQANNSTLNVARATLRCWRDDKTLRCGTRSCQRRTRGRAPLAGRMRAASSALATLDGGG
eukprot:7178027-Alexandrium_andersonii.AAC.1